MFDNNRSKNGGFRLSDSLKLILLVTAVGAVAAVEVEDELPWNVPVIHTKSHEAPVSTPKQDKPGLPEGVTRADYGVDVSFPIHHWEIATNVGPNPFGDRQAFYDDFLQGCRDYYGKEAHRCDDTERERVDMSLRQPQSMQNYTALGFAKIRAPDKLFSILRDFWEENEKNKKQEKWPSGNTYTNHWKAPTYMVSVEDTGLRGGGSGLKQRIWDAAKEVIQEWTGQELQQCSLYGIRVYTEGAVLSTHVDRLPLVSSAILNVAQDVEEDWPIEVIGRDGHAYNVTMKPGDMVLYESHSLLHGRPFPLKGNYFANIFIHFEPMGPFVGPENDNNVNVKYRRVMQQEDALDNEDDSDDKEEDGLPIYIRRGTPEAARWKQRNADGGKSAKQNKSFTSGSTNAHKAAQDGNVEALTDIVEREGVTLLYERDENGWTPLHEAARAGHFGALEFLIRHGSNVNERTQHGRGETPLWWAKKRHGGDHAVVRYLLEVGGVDIGPEL